ncbi:MAG: molybdenum cofactor biosynthesis protein MoaE [Candidatus Heimdallarchaeota archaeon]|nr:molybdenum cofactor biosynthesis protein MoaE [Candidatus Heimdallarchaeota archaeon]
MRYVGYVLLKGAISLSELIAELPENSKVGAITTFTGIVREVSDTESKKVVSMEVEAWNEKGTESMTEIAVRIGEKYQLLGMRIVHFTGQLAIGDTVVMIVITSVHRKEAFKALEEAINAYKQESPVWKKEIYEDGTGKWITTAKH